MQVQYGGKSSYDLARQAVCFEALVDGRGMAFEIGRGPLLKLCDDTDDPLQAFHAARQVILHCIVEKLEGCSEGRSDWLVIRDLQSAPQRNAVIADLVLFPEASVPLPDVQDLDSRKKLA